MISVIDGANFDSEYSSVALAERAVAIAELQTYRSRQTKLHCDPFTANRTINLNDNFLFPHLVAAFLLRHD